MKIELSDDLSALLRAAAQVRRTDPVELGLTILREGCITQLGVPANELPTRKPTPAERPRRVPMRKASRRGTQHRPSQEEIEERGRYANGRVRPPLDRKRKRIEKTSHRRRWTCPVCNKRYAGQAKLMHIPLCCYDHGKTADEAFDVLVEQIDKELNVERAEYLLGLYYKKDGSPKEKPGDPVTSSTRHCQKALMAPRLAQEPLRQSAAGR